MEHKVRLTFLIIIFIAVFLPETSNGRTIFVEDMSSDAILTVFIRHKQTDRPVYLEKTPDRENHYSFSIDEHDFFKSDRERKFWLYLSWTPAKPNYPAIGVKKMDIDVEIRLYKDDPADLDIISNYFSGISNKIINTYENEIQPDMQVQRYFAARLIARHLRLRNYPEDHADIRRMIWTAVSAGNLISDAGENRLRPSKILLDHAERIFDQDDVRLDEIKKWYQNYSN